MTAAQKEEAKDKDTYARKKARESVSADKKEMVRDKDAEARRKARASTNAKEQGEAAAKNTMDKKSSQRGRGRKGQGQGTSQRLEACKKAVGHRASTIVESRTFTVFDNLQAVVIKEN